LKSLIFHILLCIFYSHAWSQGYTVKNYSVEHGLPFVQVRGMVQDSNGSLYAFGYGSIGKFDGKNFSTIGKNIGLDEYNILSVTINEKTNDVWVGTSNGLNRISNNKVYNYNNNSDIKNERIKCQTWDFSNELWIGTENGLFKKNKNDIFEKIKGLENDTIQKIYVDKSNTVWVCTSKGICIYHREKKLECLTKKELKINGEINDIIAFGKTFFIATSEGLYHFVGQNREVGFIGAPSEKNKKVNSLCVYNSKLLMGTEVGLFEISKSGLKKITFSNLFNADMIKEVTTDYENNLWLSTDNGMYKLRPSAFDRLPIEENSTATYVFQMMRDKEKNFWFGTQYNGPYFIDQNKKINNFNSIYNTKINTTQALLEDDYGNMWIHADGKLLIKLKNGSIKKFENFPLNIVANFYKNNENEIFVCGRTGIVTFKNNDLNHYEYAEIPNTKIAYIYSLAKYDKDNLLACCSRGGIFMYNTISKIYTPLQKKVKTTNVFNIVKDKQLYYYCSTLEGVVILDQHLNYVDIINKEKGLISNFTYVVEITDDNKLLVGSNQGISIIDLDKYYADKSIIIKNYGKEEGFEGVECNINAIYKDGNKYLIGTVNGLYQYTKDREIVNLNESKLQITNIKLSYKDTALAQGSKLKYNENNLIFYFRGVSLTNPERVNYTYKLEGLDNNWTPITKDNFATYPNLPPGDYTFMVKSTNNEGKWNQTPVTFKFTIRNPYWQTGWFYMLGVSGLVGVLYFLLNIRLAQVRKSEKENFNKQLDITKHELKALRAQMNPHFIFNSLNSIQHFIVKNNDEHAIKYLNKFARLIRMILDNSESSTVTIKEEIDALKIYIELEIMRFENKFSFQMEIDSNIDIELEEIPSMLIQPYVENAILHGLTSRTDNAGVLKIQIKKQRDDNTELIICTIEDNGIGREKSAESKTLSGKMHRSLGMKVTADRLSLLNDINESAMSVNITDLKNDNGTAAGTKVEIYIPILH
jgi:ligand-binding sensor domain-containing protein